jgi:hypothetical protein
MGARLIIFSIHFNLLLFFIFFCFLIEKRYSLKTFGGFT